MPQINNYTPTTTNARIQLADFWPKPGPDPNLALILTIAESRKAVYKIAYTINIYGTFINSITLFIFCTAGIRTRVLVTVSAAWRR